MEYLGAELRAALSVTGENDGQDNLAEYGIYLKPQYTFNNNLNVYGLLGYSFINMSDPATSTDPHDNPFDGDNSGFSFGAGVDYGITQNISVFTDVVNYLRDFGGSNSTWGANLGVKYHF
jgi:outer membrane autotransporter protein